MSFESRIDAAVADALDHEEVVQDFVESITRSLGADDDVLADGMAASLYDSRTRTAILRLVRSGDRLAAATLMVDYAETTYVNEQAEMAAEKEFRL